jgi:hypothetical protein
VARDAMAGCPGYARERLGDLSVAGRRVPNPGTSCMHLRPAELVPGRFAPACHHPESAVITEAARAVLRRGAAQAAVPAATVRAG